MKNKIFLSWSGDRSREIAMELRSWIPKVLQSVELYCSVADIEKGSKWLVDINENLNSADVGLIVLTPENITSNWINFEAGALSNKLPHSKVCTLLFGVKYTDVGWPLAMFQHTEFHEEEFLRLFGSINSLNPEISLPENLLGEVHKKWFPDFELKVQKILEQASEKIPMRPDRELLDELVLFARTARGVESKNTELKKELERYLMQLIIGLDECVMEHGESSSPKDPLTESLVARLGIPLVRFCFLLDSPHCADALFKNHTYGKSLESIKHYFGG